jgi:hypothetical protein
MNNQTSFTWLRCRDGYEFTDREGAPFIQPRTNNHEPIRPLELNSALFRQLAATYEDEAMVREFADAFGMLAPFKFPLDAYDIAAGEFPSHRPGALADWANSANELRYAIKAWDDEDITEVCDTINSLKLSKLSLRLEPQTFREPPVLTVGPASLIDAIWVQLAHAVSNNLNQRACEGCGIWFSYGSGAKERADKRFHDDRCKAKFHYENNKRKKEKKT